MLSDYQTELIFLSIVLRNIHGRRILDVGAGSGEFCALLKQTGAWPVGIEQDKDRIKYPELVRAQPFDQYNQWGQFAAVCFLESLYYLPESTLDAVRSRNLERDGVVFIKSHIVDSPYYWQRHPKDRVGPAAKTFMSYYSLRNYIIGSGFQIVKEMQVPLNSPSGWKRRLFRHLPPDRVMIIARPRDSRGRFS